MIRQGRSDRVQGVPRRSMSLFGMNLDCVGGRCRSACAWPAVPQAFERCQNGSADSLGACGFSGHLLEQGPAWAANDFSGRGHHSFVRCRLCPEGQSHPCPGFDPARPQERICSNGRSLARHSAKPTALKAASVADVPNNSLVSFFGNVACAIRTSSPEDGRSTNPLRSYPRVRPDLFMGLREY